MQISQIELERLNFYRASELHGGLMLGQLVQRVRDPELITELTRHAAEEVVHSQLWTETILRVGGTPAPVRDTYQRHYARVLAPCSVLQVLALTQVFERRVYRHFQTHLRQPDTHREVKRTLLRMIEEEKHHLCWVKRWLDAAARQRGTDSLCRLMANYTEIDRVIYDRLCERYRFRRAA